MRARFHYLRAISTVPFLWMSLPVEREVQFQNVDAWFTQESKLTVFGVCVN